MTTTIRSEILSTLSELLRRHAAADASVLSEAKQWLRENGQPGDARNPRMVRLTVEDDGNGAVVEREELRAEVARRLEGAARVGRRLSVCFDEHMAHMAGMVGWSRQEAYDPNSYIDLSWNSPQGKGDADVIVPFIVASLYGLDNPRTKASGVLATLRAL